MANLKQCQTCHKVKDTNQYSKCKSNKDGLQYCCKECNKKTNLKFRTEINPMHHKIWQDKNWDTFMEYMRKYRKADKGGIIYSITNPVGFQYIGMTEAYEKVRFSLKPCVPPPHDMLNGTPTCLSLSVFKPRGIISSKFSMV